MLCSSMHITPQTTLLPSSTQQEVARCSTFCQLEPLPQTLPILPTLGLVLALLLLFPIPHLPMATSQPLDHRLRWIG